MRNLKSELGKAIAWGVPCQYSTGYSSAELVVLLKAALKRIQYLETALDLHQVPYTHTDFKKSDSH